MNKVTVLDLTLTELNKQTNSGTLATIEDLKQKIKIDKSSILRALEYLVTLNYCVQVNNGYQITFEGEYFIDKNKFFFKNKSFLFENIYKKLKFVAVLLNTLLVLALGWLNYANNKDKSKNQAPLTTGNTDTIKVIQIEQSNPFNEEKDTLRKKIR